MSKDQKAQIGPTPISTSPLPPPTSLLPNLGTIPPSLGMDPNPSRYLGTPNPSSSLGMAREVAEICSDQREHSYARLAEGECPKCSGQINQLLHPMGERDGIGRCLTCESIILIDGVDLAPDRSITLDQILIELSLRAMNPKSFNN